MIIQIRLGPETLWAILAAERLFPGVLPVVNAQGTRLGESGAAHVTFVRFLACVGESMAVQVAFVRVHLVADVTPQGTSGWPLKILNAKIHKAAGILSCIQT